MGAAQQGHPLIYLYCICPSHVHGRHLVDVSTHGGFTPLMYAAWFDHPEASGCMSEGGSKGRA